MPSHTPKQAKTMSAIAHGWRPTGDAAGIPVKVAKEFHAADKGKKYGKGGKKDSKFHSVRHSPGGPANNDGYVSAMKTGSLTHHAKQPRGKGIMPKGATPEHTHSSGQSYAAEQREHWGGEATKHGSEMRKNRSAPANVGSSDRGSELIEQCGMGHTKQPHKGDNTGAGHTGVAEHHRGHTLHAGGNVLSHAFRQIPATNAHGYRGTHRAGFLRTSGHSGAHQIGKRK